ncbi:exodeoxyribonuclease V subunit gamma [soil metagenome]
MALLTHIASHPDVLVSRLCDELVEPPEDPFASDIVCVPTRGIERWLTQSIASELADRGIGDGICANVQFPSPRRLVASVVASVPGLAEVATAWEGTSFTYRVLSTIDTNLGQPWMRLLARHLASSDGDAHPRRLAAAVKLAGLFGRYSRYRPEMIRAWASGEDVGADGSLLAESHRWQAELWRSLRAEIGSPSVPELGATMFDPVRRGEVDLGLPTRLAVYGLTSADPLDLQVLEAVSHTRDVHLFVLHPSPALWKLTSGRMEDPINPDRVADPTSDLAAHPFLSSWATESRELQLLLAAHGATGTPIPKPNRGQATILSRLQSDVEGNLPPSFDPELAAAVEAGEDRSVQIHVCHGVRRQVEVLRDAICHVLVADPTLEARDVVIMTPDLATFAPLLEAAFHRGDSSADGVPDLRVRIADRSPAATNPLVRFAASVLDIAGGRLEASVVGELVTRPVVQNRFGFDLAAAGDLMTLVDDSNISWGLDAAHREQWRAGALSDRTWRRGLDRVLTGVFYSDNPVRVVGDTAPLDGMEGQAAEVGGLLAQILDRLAAARRLFSEPLAMSEWASAVSTAVRMLAAPAWGEEWQWSQLDRLLAETFPMPVGDEPDPSVTLAEVRRAVSAWADDRPSPLHFRSGDVTVCTLAPMRSVPYRVMCLLGMEDDRFPRSSRNDGADLLVGHERPGDFDRGSQDRQLLMDAVMAAGDHLIVTYAGRDELTNAGFPPAVPIAELIDTLAEMVGPDTARRVETVHPLQSFSVANFTDRPETKRGVWGFDPAHLESALAVQARIGRPEPPPPQWPEYPDSSVIDLADLISFLQDPVGQFVKVRLGFSVHGGAEAPDDTIPVDLDPLDRWAVTDRLLRGLWEGHALEQLVARERHGGAIPPGALGLNDVAEVTAAALDLHRAACDHGIDPSSLRPLAGTVDVEGVSVEGTIEVDPVNGHLAVVTPSRIRAKQRLGLFVGLVFATALQPDISWTALLLGRRPQGRQHLVVTMGPIESSEGRSRQEVAATMLAELVRLYHEGHRQPLPMPCETSYAFQSGLGKGRPQALRGAAEAWSGKFGEGHGGARSLVLSDLSTLDALLATDFERYCARLWRPIVPITTQRYI